MCLKGTLRYKLTFSILLPILNIKQKQKNIKTNAIINYSKLLNIFINIPSLKIVKY